MDLFTTIAAPLVVGITLAVLIEAVRWLILWPRRRRQRRRQIVALMSRVTSIVRRAHERRCIEAGDLQLPWSSPIGWLPAELVNEIDRLTWEALQLFEPKDALVAEWAQYEFSAALYAEPDQEGWWKAPRHEELLEWADHNQNPPFYAWAGGEGDTYRHDMIIPNSDANYAIIIDAPSALQRTEALPLLDRWRSRRKGRIARDSWGH